MTFIPEIPILRGKSLDRCCLLRPVYNYLFQDLFFRLNYLRLARLDCPPHGDMLLNNSSTVGYNDINVYVTLKLAEVTVLNLVTLNKCLNFFISI